MNQDSHVLTDLVKVSGEDHEDPSFEPPKLFLVKRIKHIKGNPYWDKQILKTFGLYSWKGHPSVVVKNIPEVNARLWKIKHLVEITPITFPQGPPQEGDYGGTFLKENGEFVVSPRLQVDSARIEETAKFIGDESKMDGPTLKKQLRLRWLNPFNLD
uniref:Large ribosomal subunit protein uL30m n=1 Tax=Timema tahoe TaxID=61484 RepID=A0A7R9IBI7_9NEOP|nr:unnamed protein product [Timema tahoe]